MNRYDIKLYDVFNDKKGDFIQFENIFDRIERKGTKSKSLQFLVITRLYLPFEVEYKHIYFQNMDHRDYIKHYLDNYWNETELERVFIVKKRRGRQKKWKPSNYSEFLESSLF